ncbi:uncharacterized protein BXZ73DRAFT_50887 [Epithele typhae]|uniref:uncharacterized protein n=1 Tax=Epithele typhae TaxID=378194 RepID=UPI0020073722|nr:uncharacterized protein BXZ73DRAFT_50887 [Epithele typhae]KAH9923752.1 hypothetical protein BXZ73DRAFT_50887 [Epithele typhae]
MKECASGHSVWGPADDARLFATFQGALVTTRDELRLLRPPQNRDRGGGEGSVFRGPVTRTQTRILAGHGQRVQFAFRIGSRSVRRYGMPMYALANATEEEVAKHMADGRERVKELMRQVLLKRVRVRFEWPIPGEDAGFFHYEEWVKFDSKCTKARFAMTVARVFQTFVEKHYYLPDPHGPADSPWVLRPDAFYRVWLHGLERVENSVFVAHLRYIKRYPNETS